MFPFSPSVTPAVRNHLDAQVSYMNDLSKSMFKSFQQMCDLHIQLAQTMLEETTTASEQFSTHTRPADAISAVSARAQPTAEKLRAYQQHLSRVAADAQVDLARVNEEHVQETTRTAKALADEVKRVATEETERSMHAHQETMRNFTDPFTEMAQRSESTRSHVDGTAISSASPTIKQPTAQPTTPGRTSAPAQH